MSLSKAHFLRYSYFQLYFDRSLSIHITRMLRQEFARMRAFRTIKGNSHNTKKTSKTPNPSPGRDIASITTKLSPVKRIWKFRRRGITQKKSYNIQNTAKVWNQISCFCHIFREPLSQHVRSTSWRQQVQTPAVMTKTFNFYSRLPIHCHHCFSEKLLILLLLSPCTINNPSYIVYLGEDGKNMRDLERYLLLFAYCFLSLFIFTDWRWYEWVI